MELRRNILGFWVGVVMYEHLEIDSDVLMQFGVCLLAPRRDGILRTMSLRSLREV